MPIVATFAVSSFTTLDATKNVNVTTQPGDVLVISAGGEYEGVTIGTPSGNGVSFTLRQSITITDYSTAYLWTGTDNTGGTYNVSMTAASGSMWGFTVMVARNMTVGTSVKNNASGTPSISITTTATDCTVVAFTDDWNAIDGSSRTWLTVNGTTPTAGNLLEVGYGYANVRYTIYSAYYPDTGAAGSKTVGLSAPGGQKYSIFALELIPVATSVEATTAWLATSATTPTLRAAATNSALATNSLGVVIPSSVQPGELLLLFVAQASFSTTLFNAISGWLKIGEQRAGGAAQTMAVFMRIVQTGDAGATVTSTSVNSENFTAQVRAYYGVNQVSPIDTTVGFAEQDPASTTASAPSVTTVTASATIVTAFSIPTTSGVVLTDADWTPPANFGNEVTSSSNSGSVNNAALAVYDWPRLPVASYGPFTATVTDSRRWAMVTLALRPTSTPLLYETFSIDNYFSSLWATQPGPIYAGRLHLRTTEAYSGVLTSSSTYDLSNRSLSVHAPVVASAASSEMWIQIGADDNNRVIIGKGGASMLLRVINGGVTDDQYVTYNATDHQWWRLRLTGTLLEWQTSPDGGNWTTLRSATSGYPSLTNGNVQLVTGHYTPGDPDEVVEFDTINLS
jgi:hypothetical protein